MTGGKALLNRISFLLFYVFGFYLIETKVNSNDPVLYQYFTNEELRNYLTNLLARNESLRLCPAPRQPFDRKDCETPVCKNDGDCPSQNQSCCFNGCIFTCVDKISPPPVIDWDEEPLAPPVRKEGTAVVRCTTSPRPAPSEPVGCPKGYICKIDEYGDPLTGMSNTGVCVPDTTQDETKGEDSDLKENTRKQTVYLPGGCVLSEIQYKHMQDFMTRPYVEDCFCIEGSVECRVTL